MEIKTREILKKEYVNEYIAIDGTLFTSEDECKKYEQSAKMTVYSKYQPLIISRKSEYEIYGTGSDEYEIDIIKIKQSEDIDTLIQLNCLYNSSVNEKETTELRNKLYDWYSTDETILIGRGCSYDGYDCFWFIDTVSNVVEHIIKACIKEKKNNISNSTEENYYEKEES